MPTSKQSELPNTWTGTEAARWAGIPYRLLLEFFDQGLLPAIPVGQAQEQKMPKGRKRRRRVAKWLVPVQAFIAAWQTFTVPRKRPARRAA